MRLAVALSLLLCSVLSAQEKIEIGKVLSSRVISTRYEDADKTDAQLRAEGFRPGQNGEWVKIEWLDKKSKPKETVEYAVPRFGRNPRYPSNYSPAMAIPSAGAASGSCATGDCAACAANGNCNGNCAACTSGNTGRPPLDTGGSEDHGDILNALKPNKELLEALKGLVDPKADRTDVQSAIDTVISNQAKLLQALTEMAGSGGGDSTELAIQLQRNTQELNALVEAISQMDGNVDGISSKLNEVLTTLKNQSGELQGLKNEVHELRDGIALIRAGQKEFDIAMKKFEIKLANIENGQFRFKMTIDPKTGKVIALDPAKSAGE